MAVSLRDHINQALVGCLVPLARLLLRSGIGYGEFSDIAKRVFVDVAISDFGKRGRPTNISRVAVMTGLTRKEVRRIRDLNSERALQITERKGLPSDLLHYWFTDTDYLTEAGGPAPIPYAGEIRSFCALVKRCGGDIPPGAMREELIRTGAVRERGDGLLEALRWEYRPADTEGRLIEALDFGLRMLASTIAYNSSPDRNEDSLRFQRVASSREVKRSQMQSLESEMFDRLKPYLEAIDDRISNYEIRPGEKADTAEFGVGIYIFAEEKNRAQR